MSNVKWFSIIGILYYTGAFSFISRVLIGGSDDAQLNDNDGNFINQFFGVFIIVGSVYYNFSRKKIINFEWKILAPYFLFIIYTFMSIAWSVEPEISARRCFAVLPVVLLAHHLSSSYSADLLYKLVGLIVGIVAVCGVFMAIVLPDFAFHSGGLRDGAFIGLLTDKNGGARVYMLGLTLLLPAMLSGSRQALAGAVICFACLSLTQSASGVMLLMITLATMLNFYVFSGKYGRASNFLLLVFGIGVYITFLILANLLYEYLVELAGRDPTLTDRTVIWDSIMPLIYDKLYFGYGFGAFWASFGADDFVQRWGYIGNAHNGYIETALNGGLFAILIVIFMIINTIYWFLSLSIVRDHKIFATQSLAIFLTIVFSNFIAYTIPNYRSFDFFIFTLLIFCAAFRVAHTANRS